MNTIHLYSVLSQRRPNTLESHCLSTFCFLVESQWRILRYLFCLESLNSRPSRFPPRQSSGLACDRPPFLDRFPCPALLLLLTHKPPFPPPCRADQQPVGHPCVLAVVSPVFNPIPAVLAFLRLCPGPPASLPRFPASCAKGLM